MTDVDDLVKFRDEAASECYRELFEEIEKDGENLDMDKITLGTVAEVRDE